VKVLVYLNIPFMRTAKRQSKWCYFWPQALMEFYGLA